jgi:hypothetical protein
LLGLIIWIPDENDTAGSDIDWIMNCVDIGSMLLPAPGANPQGVHAPCGRACHQKPAYTRPGFQHRLKGRFELNKRCISLYSKTLQPFESQ